MLNKTMNDLDKKKMVAVVVPFFKEDLTSDKCISLKHLRKFLGHYDKYLVVPKGLKLNFGDDFLIKEFDKASFSSHAAHSKFRLSKKFYRAFSDYNYVLIYELDSLVFSDRLVEWCEKEYDYIGAPWFKNEVRKAVNWGLDRDYVGNSGFSLRNVQSCINILQICNSPINIIKSKLFDYLSFCKYCIFKIPKKLFKFITQKKSLQCVFVYAKVQKKIIFHKENEVKNEDLFWSFNAKKYYPDFKIPSPEIAVSFSFEVGPRYCFSKNRNTLPFGCHAWAKYDRQFWEPYLLK